MRILPGFSLMALVLATCATLTSVQSQRATGDSTTEASRSSNTEDSECATSRLNCVNLHSSSNDALNRQVNLELSAFYSYTSMASYFASTDGALRGCAALFRDQASEELTHGNMFMDYIISRGGDLNLEDVRTPNRSNFESALDAMEHALEMEIHVTHSLLEMYRVADEHGDPSLADFIDSNFIDEQVSSIDELAHYVAVLERFNGDPVGEYMFDETLYEERRG